MPQLAPRPWVPAPSEALTRAIAAEAGGGAAAVAGLIAAAAAGHRRRHEREAINLNPAGNVMNPAAEALLAAGLGTRASLGWPGDKYETGLQDAERIETLAAELAAQVFGARYAEVRVPSGAMANLFAFMALAKPGDRIVAPPAEIGGHVTHHGAGAAGLYGLEVHPAPVDAAGFTVDVEGLRRLALRVRPRVITLGGSLNLLPHPVREVRAVADEVGAALMFDAAHLCGVISGGAWPNPLAEGAHVMTMSTYKSLGGPAGGLVVTNDPEIAERLDRIAYPGMTANFDLGRVAALALTLLDWREVGAGYAAEMVATARALAAGLAARGLPVHGAAEGFTRSHQLALEAARWGGGTAMARRLERAGLLASGIGLPVAAVAGDQNGLRLGTPEMVRWGMGPAEADAVAGFLHAALTGDPEAVAAQVAAFRAPFDRVRHVRPSP